MAMYDSIFTGWQIDKGVGRSYVPTLQSAPTTSTLTFTLESNTIDFEVGQFVRVADQNQPTGYRVYQLMDIVTVNNVKSAKWEMMLVSSDIDGKEDVCGIEAPVNQLDATAPITTLTCAVSKYYRIDVAVETLAVTLPAMENITSVKTVVLYLTGGTTPAVTISSTAPSGGTAPDVHYQYGFSIESGKTYEVNCMWNGLAWIVASVEIVKL